MSQLSTIRAALHPRNAVPVAMAAIAMLLASGAATNTASAGFTLTTLDDQNADSDLNFNQLLGINNYGIIVGYDGDGTVEPNKGYLFVPAEHYADENFPASAQTQVTGISNTALFPTTVGFYVDGAGDNIGFTDVNGSFVSVKNPHEGVIGGVTFTQLLGVNASGEAAGIYIDGEGNFHGFTYDISTEKFTGVTLPFSGITQTQANGINDAGVICGDYVTKSGTYGFFGKPGAYQSVSIKGYAGTTFLGINNKGFAVGFVTTTAGVTEGLYYNTAKGTFLIVKDPNQSTKTAFNVNGTTVNGINDDDDIVGFYSDGTKVHGFLGVPN